MDDGDFGLQTLEEWRRKNRGLVYALSVSVAIWAVCIWVMIRH
jgi:hypothetical protein